MRQKPAGMTLVFNLWSKISTDTHTNEQYLIFFLTTLCKHLGLTSLSVDSRVFPETGGISINVIISESSASLHTWPEYGYIRILIDSCKPVDIDKAFNVVSEKLQVSREEIEWKVIPW